MHQKSLAKETLKTQRELEEIKNNANADELILNDRKEINNDESEFNMELLSKRNILLVKSCLKLD